MKKDELIEQLDNAHNQLDQLGVARGDAFGYWDLPRRIRKLADATADVRREAHRLLYGEE